MVATQPDIEPDRITPQAPPEAPPGSPPDENPFTEPPGFEPPMPGENDPYPGIPETPRPLD